jgi:hypothetical protein
MLALGFGIGGNVTLGFLLWLLHSLERTGWKVFQFSIGRKAAASHKEKRDRRGLVVCHHSMTLSLASLCGAVLPSYLCLTRPNSDAR